MFKVGQKVICKVYGEGVVDSVDAGETYPVEVEFPNGKWDRYTVDGKLYEDEDELYETDDEPSLSVIEE